MAKQQTARQRDEVAAPTPQKKAPEPEPVVAMSVEARARASRRRKMEELAAAAPVATAAKAEAAAASKASSSATAQAASAPGGDAPYKSSLFDDGAFEEALKGVNDVAAGLEIADAGEGIVLAEGSRSRDGDGGVDAEDRRGGDGVQRRGRFRPSARGGGSAAGETDGAGSLVPLPGRRSAPG